MRNLSLYRMIKEENHAENNQGCVGCPSAQMETIEEAALVHGIEPDLLVARVNAFVESKQA